MIYRNERPFAVVGSPEVTLRSLYQLAILPASIPHEYIHALTASWFGGKTEVFLFDRDQTAPHMTCEFDDPTAREIILVSLSPTLLFAPLVGLFYVAPNFVHGFDGVFISLQVWCSFVALPSETDIEGARTAYVEGPDGFDDIEGEDARGRDA